MPGQYFRRPSTPKTLGIRCRLTRIVPDVTVRKRCAGFKCLLR
ncbi:hypothetical protein ACVL91_001250 [Bradyrhizobium elkanii]|uniref:Uncharacterized protein n=1 Tax=Bradyrhizobium elkanii TaxID=29448 RepID=A0A8I1YBP9_BRAEL|nr:hypothetical protein [Bradyrhizobium elkanii]